MHHQLVRGKLLKRLAAHVRVTVYNLRFKDYYSINKKRWMQRRKMKDQQQKVQDEMNNNFGQMRAPRIKKKSRKTEEKKAERKAKML